jgi:hypothetical protein
MTSSTRCTIHPAFDADYCPVCGTATPIGDRALDAQELSALLPMEIRAADFVARTRDMIADTDERDQDPFLLDALIAREIVR